MRGLVLLTISALLALMTCPFPSAVPGPSLDNSWGFAVHAWASGSNGRVPTQYFTYGPLGFLVVPVRWHGSTYAAAVLCVLLIQVALCRVVLARLQRLVPTPVAVVLTLALTALVSYSPAEVFVVVVTLTAVEVLQRGPFARPRTALALACAVTGPTLLVKFSTGLVTLLLLIVVAATLGGVGLRARVQAGVTALLGSLLVSALSFWAITGELSSFPAWLRGSKEISSGYTAMAREGLHPTDPLDYVYLVPVVLALIAVALVTAFLRRDPVSVSAAVVLTLTTYLTFREGFSRHDASHVGILVSALLLLPLGLVLSGRARLLPIPLILATIAFGTQHLPTIHVKDSYALVSHLRRTDDRLRQIVTPGRTVHAGQASIRRRFPVPPEVLDELRGHRVSIDGYDTGIIWAYDLHWVPDVVPATYSSYTPWLDSRKARSLSRPGGPDRILRYAFSGEIDRKHELFESPQYQLDLQCHWQAVLTSGLWQVLAPGPDTCGTASTIATTHFRAGQPITVPQARVPGGVVTVRLKLDLPLSLKLEDLLFRPLTLPLISLDRRQYRFVVATATGPLILRLPPGHPGNPRTFQPVDVNTVSVPFAGTATFEERDPT